MMGVLDVVRIAPLQAHVKRHVKNVLPSGSHGFLSDDSQNGGQ